MEKSKKPRYFRITFTGGLLRKRTYHVACWNCNIVVGLGDVWNDEEIFDVTHHHNCEGVEPYRCRCCPDFYTPPSTLPGENERFQNE